MAAERVTRRCEDCGGYDPGGEPGMRCRKLNGWAGMSFESSAGDCNCVHYRASASIAGFPPGRRGEMKRGCRRDIDQ